MSTSVENAFRTVLKGLLLMAFFGAAPSANAGFWFLHEETVTLQPGEFFHFHKEDLRTFGAHTWKTVHWLQAGTVSIHQEVVGSIHLEPDEVFSMHALSSSPFLDREWFENIGNETQTLQGSYQVNGGPVVSIGPTDVDPGDQAHVEVDVDVPDANGDFTLWKEIQNVDPFSNWWGFETENWWTDLVVDADGTWSDHHWFGGLLFDAEWLWFENTGNDVVSFDFRYEIHVPEPAPVALLGAGLIALVMLRARRRYSVS